MPRQADIAIIRIGDTLFLKSFFEAMPVPASSTNIIIPFISGEKPASTSEKPNSVPRSIIKAVASISATTHGLTPDKNALTPAY